MSSVRIYRRKSFSRSWNVIGGFGRGGDSGAWVIQNNTHRVVGHVLAWCQHNRIAYICPMQVLLEDIRRVLGAKTIFLPGSAEHAASHSRTASSPQPILAPLHTNNPYYAQARSSTGGNATTIEQLGAAVQGLGIMDSNADTHAGHHHAQVMAYQHQHRHHPPPKTRRSRLELVTSNSPPLNANSESDKENMALPVKRSMLNVNVNVSVMGLKEQRPGPHGAHPPHLETPLVEVAP